MAQPEPLPSQPGKVPKHTLGDRDSFMQSLGAFYKEGGLALEGFPWPNGRIDIKIPVVRGDAIDLFVLYRETLKEGGYQEVTATKGGWAEVYRRTGLKKATNGSWLVRTLYQRYLLAYEEAKHWRRAPTTDLRTAHTTQLKRKPETEPQVALAPKEPSTALSSANTPNAVHRPALPASVTAIRTPSVPVSGPVPQRSGNGPSPFRPPQAGSASQKLKPSQPRQNRPQLAPLKASLGRMLPSPGPLTVVHAAFIDKHYKGVLTTLEGCRGEDLAWCLNALTLLSHNLAHDFELARYDNLLTHLCGIPQRWLESMKSCSEATADRMKKVAWPQFSPVNRGKTSTTGTLPLSEDPEGEPWWAADVCASQGKDDLLRHQAICVSNIIRNLSLINVNEETMADNPACMSCCVACVEVLAKQQLDLSDIEASGEVEFFRNMIDALLNVAGSFDLSVDGARWSPIASTTGLYAEDRANPLGARLLTGIAKLSHSPDKYLQTTACELIGKLVAPTLREMSSNIGDVSVLSGASGNNEPIMARVCTMFLPGLTLALGSGDSDLEAAAAGALMGYSQLDDKTKTHMASSALLMQVIVGIICKPHSSEVLFSQAANIFATIAKPPASQVYARSFEDQLADALAHASSFHGDAIARCLQAIYI